MITKLKRTPGIYLVGFMGSGKTTIGKLLAERLGWAFADLDNEIEAQERCSIAQIFETRGEGDFRRLEADAVRAHVRKVELGQPTVVALGGGAFVQPANFDMVQENGITVWLDCPFEVVKQRVAQQPHRPLARDAAEFERLFDARQESYRRAHFRIAIEADDPAVAVEAILKLPIF
jgi:shikimate kinase